MRLRITSDGTPYGTRVVDAGTGAPVENVLSVSWRADVDRVTALVEILAPAVEVEADPAVLVEVRRQ